MAARALASGTISFGLVSIPVKLYTAASAEGVHFNMLHAGCGARLKQQMICPTHDQVVPRDQTVKGYEYSRGQYVLFTEEEVKALETARSSSLEILEFVPLSTVDLIQVEKSYFLGPDKGGDRAYRLLSEAMERTKRVAVGRWAARGKEQLVLIRPYEDGLILHQMYYANEMRAFDEIDRGAKVEFKDVERDLADKLIAELTVKAFDAGKYHDEYTGRVEAAVEQKVQGQQITVAPEQPKAQIIDLFDALKKSLSEVQEKAQVAGKGEPAGEVAARPLKKATAASKPEGKTRRKKTG
ncbi:MAG TPA: Ku protein [Polyangiaceae bacterium]|nr:Ku protein [Polyangiaceae bacterium]